MKQDILIIGGYGAVGRHLVMELVKTYPERIVVAGRDLNKANAFVLETGYPLRTMQVDISKVEQLKECFEEVHTILMCIEPKDTKFAELCIDNGVHYVDISASNKVPSQIKLLEERALQNKVTCILGVGIAPGLSTLLAEKVTSEMEVVNAIDFTLMLGLGEQHGTDGVRWFLEHLKTDFEVDGVVLKPFINQHQAYFSQPLGKRKAYSFDLADRQIMSETLDIPTLTYFCYDSPFMTSLLHVLKKWKILNILKNPKIFNLFLKIFSSDKMSKNAKLTDIFGLHVKISGSNKGKNLTHYGSIIGNNSSTITSKVVAYTALELTRGSYPAGVYYLSEVASLGDVVEGLGEELTIEFFSH